MREFIALYIVIGVACCMRASIAGKQSQVKESEPGLVTSLLVQAGMWPLLVPIAVCLQSLGKLSDRRIAPKSIGVSIVVASGEQRAARWHEYRCNLLILLVPATGVEPVTY